jgi:hypothetical protein
LDHGLHVLKNAGDTSIVLWITAPLSKEFQHPAIQTKIEQHEAAQNFEVFSNIQE